MPTLIKEYINNCLHLQEAALQDIESFFEQKTIPKKTIMLRDGEICRFEGFIKKGCIKTYFIDKNGLEVVLTFATENWWISNIASFEEQVPGNMFIETVEDTDLLLLTYQTKAALLEQHPALEKMFRLLVQRHLHTYQERLFTNIALTAEERYARFLKKFPALPQRIPQHLIASYLGISPEFLSRLRSRKLKQ